MNTPLSLGFARRAPVLLLLLLLLLPAAPVLAQAPQDDLKKDVEGLKQGQQEILKQLDEIKKMVQARPAAQPSGPNVKDVVFNLGSNPAKGSATAKLTLVEFTDYQ